MCTSLALGFYVKGESEWEDLKERLNYLKGKENCILTVMEEAPKAMEMEDGREEVVDEDDFVLI